MRRTFGRFTSLAVVATTAVFVACDESPTSLDAQDQALATPELAAHAGNPVVLSARGSGHSEGPNIGAREVGWRTFSFNAVQRLDGTTTGKVRYDTHGEGLEGVTHRQQGRVICMNTIASPNGDIVIIGAENKQRSPADNPTNILSLPPTETNNHGMFFAVRDNGEGASATGPDEFTGVVHTVLTVPQGYYPPFPEGLPLVAAICDNPAAFRMTASLAESFFNEVEAGNIQVKP